MSRHANPDRYRLDDYLLTDDGPVRVRVIGHYGTPESAQWRLDTRESRYPLLYGGDHPTHRMEIIDTRNRGTK
jgi:hypothetical protein